MSKKAKIDESVDSDDLQALFDSIAAGAPAEAAAPEASASPPEPAAADGDDDSLQALFDEVAATFEAEAVGTEEEEGVVVPQMPDEDPSKEVYTRIGHMTRQVHDTLRALGFDSESLTDAVEGIPDARQRLSYIAHMTEQAASRVLNATDVAKPLQDDMQRTAGELETRWDRLFANELSVEEFKQLADETRSFIGGVRSSSETTNTLLMEIIMAQDFQDLTGQVIKKVVDLAQTLESELLELLIETMPENKRPAKKQGDALMNGPVIDNSRPDVVTSQEQVDDLLDSLGF